MAIDFYDITDTRRKNRLFAIAHNDFDLIYEAVIELERKTGVTIDPYGTGPLYKDHIQIVTSAIQKMLDNPNFKDLFLKSKLQKVLTNLSISGEGFIIEGD